MSIKSWFMAERPAQTSATPMAPMAPVAWEERRACYRKPVSWPARCRARDSCGALREHSASIKNIGQGGALIHLPAARDLEDLLEVEVRQQGLTFRSSAAILSKRVTDRGMEIRVRFEHLSLVTQDVLTALMAGTIGLSWG